MYLYVSNRPDQVLWHIRETEDIRYTFPVSLVVGDAPRGYRTSTSLRGQLPESVQLTVEFNSGEAWGVSFDFKMSELSVDRLLTFDGGVMTPDAFANQSCE